LKLLYATNRQEFSVSLFDIKVPFRHQSLDYFYATICFITVREENELLRNELSHGRTRRRIRRWSWVGHQSSFFDLLFWSTWRSYSTPTWCSRVVAIRPQKNQQPFQLEQKHPWAT